MWVIGEILLGVWWLEIVRQGGVVSCRWMVEGVVYRVSPIAYIYVERLWEVAPELCFLIGIKRRRAGAFVYLLASCVSCERLASWILIRESRIRPKPSLSSHLLVHAALPPNSSHTSHAHLLPLAYCSIYNLAVLELAARGKARSGTAVYHV